MPNFSNYNDSGRGSFQDSAFREVYLLLLTQSLVRLSRHTHQNVMSQPKYGQINCGLTILIVSVFPVPLTKYDTALNLALLTKWLVFFQNTSDNPIAGAVS